ncbi:DUF3164 family protein [Flavobacterium sp. B183]|uniref:DUF3164 family protein n=1 Tax=Flavobacterium sp. B183 TaxID=907046 RepID=UPI00201F692D|nr:DUF3164 family protein [Flavobacterium sp. B183]URC13967.1 DUF3164 family protein [Flavobacterium sp. B183]URC14012.1 DUF3164 family protein [Flavobacterium sp. B183]
MQTTPVTIPINNLSADQLRELLKNKETEEKQQKEKIKKEYLNDKETFLNEVLNRFKDAKDILETLKKETIINSEMFNTQKYSVEGKSVKEAKSFELKNDNVKIVVESQDRLSFNDQAVVHITAIKDIFREKFENRNKGFYNLLDGILMKNSKGDYDAKLLTKARRQVKDLGDESLIEEFDKLNDCLVVTGSAKYVRVYTREDNRWKDVSLNFSSL